MTLIVEDGTALATAESYVSVADASTILTARGSDQWMTMTTTQMEQALRRATAFMVGRYRLRWLGTRMTMTQALDWPRSLVPMRDVPFTTYLLNTIVPQDVKTACALLALRAASGPLLADQSQRKHSVTVGPISTVYAEGAPVAVQYVEVDNMLRAYMKNGAGQVNMVRA
jgi:hypothetical protein